MRLISVYEVSTRFQTEIIRDVKNQRKQVFPLVNMWHTMQDFARNYSRCCEKHATFATERVGRNIGQSAKCHVKAVATNCTTSVPLFMGVLPRRHSL